MLRFDYLENLNFTLPGEVKLVSLVDFRHLALYSQSDLMYIPSCAVLGRVVEPNVSLSLTEEMHNSLGLE